MNTLLKKHTQNLKENKKGFTLVELIIVLVIIAILAAIAIPSMLSYINQANERVILADGRSAYTAAQAVFTEKVAKGEEITASSPSTTDWAKEIAKYMDNKNTVTPDFTVSFVFQFAANGTTATGIDSFTYTDTAAGKTVTFGTDNPPVVETTANNA